MPTKEDGTRDDNKMEEKGNNEIKIKIERL
jgi:hypothetical protein